MSLDKQYSTLLIRRHPYYNDLLPQWEFYDETYKGGRAWFNTTNIFHYYKEGTTEYNDRLNRAYRFNHSKEIVDIVNKYIFKSPISRAEDAPDYIQKFWKISTKDKKPIQDLAKNIDRNSSIFGRIWMVVDSNNSGQILTKADEKENEIGVYAYVVKPQYVLDMSYDEFGELNWILIYEPQRDDSDPFNYTGNIINCYRLWTREKWFKIQRLEPSNYSNQPNTSNSLSDNDLDIEEGVHNLGFVPVFKVDNVPSDDLYSSNSMLSDIAYLDRAIANYLSNLDAIIQDQTFSQLAMPSSGMMPGEDGYQSIISMGTKRVFTYDGESGEKPFYLSPDPKQASVILAVINKIISEIYNTVGLAGERTKEDNAAGIDNSSGVAKAYDFERINTLLTSKASVLQDTENKLVKFVAKWYGEDIDVDYVKYPIDFDIRSLYDEFEVATQLGLIQATPTMRKKQMEIVVEKLFPAIKADIKKKMLDEIEKFDYNNDVNDANSVNTPKKGLQNINGNTQGQNNKEAKK